MTSRESVLHKDTITLDSEEDVQEWTQLFGVSEPELRAALDAVGNSEEKVREYLASQASTPP